MKHDSAVCWIDYSVIDCFGTAYVSRNPKVQSIRLVAAFMSCGSRDNNLLQHMARPTVGAQTGQRKLLSTEWAKSTLSNLQTSKQHSESHQEVEVSCVTCLTRTCNEESQDQDGFNAAALNCTRATKCGRQMDETERHDRRRVEFLHLRRVHGDREVGHVFDTTRGIARGFQRRTAHCALCSFETSDSSDSNRHEPHTIGGRVERSNMCVISGSLVYSQRNS